MECPFIVGDKLKHNLSRDEVRVTAVTKKGAEFKYISKKSPFTEEGGAGILFKFDNWKKI